MLVEIVRRLGECQLIFVASDENRSRLLHRRLETVFTRAGVDFEKHVVFIRWQKRPEFYGLLQRVDAMLDTIGFSGFNTAMQAIECGLPIVALEGRFMRGRLASGILKRIGLSDLVARTNEEYISLAVKLARDSELRSQFSARIEANRHILFNDTVPIRALEDFLVGVTHASRKARQEGLEAIASCSIGAAPSSSTIVAAQESPRAAENHHAVA
jgi:predicted O-linked N-acetylglucosamine transferase (SPINDLY family)